MMSDPSCRFLLSITLLVCCFSQMTTAFYLPGMYPKAHPVNSSLDVKVNSLTSVTTGLPFNYYDLPFCKSPDGVKRSQENFGELLMGDLIENSAYKLKMLVTELVVKACDSPSLTNKAVKNFKQKIDDVYYVNLLLDNLPATTAILEDNPGNVVTGFPLGYKKGGKYFVYNHIIFKILVHPHSEQSSLQALAAGDSAMEVVTTSAGRNNSGYLVVGFEVAACSIARQPDSSLPQYTSLSALSCRDSEPQEVKAGSSIVYTYDVHWEESPIVWASRWDAYLKMNGDQVHWFSILNSLMVILFLAGMVFVILLRSVHRDLANMDQMDKEEAAQMAEESGWKLVVGDVFRAPAFPGLLSVLVGSGVQIMCMAVVTIFFAALGFMSPASRGALLMGIVVLYLLLGVPAGYLSARLWTTLTGVQEGTLPLALRVAGFFPGVTAVGLSILNLLVWSVHSTGAVPFSVFFELFFLWFLISVPLTVLGTYYGMKADRLQYPVRTNQIPRQIPEQRYPSWLLVVGGGILPFGTLYIELFFIMSSIWMQRVYYGFGFLLIVLILLMLVCAEVAVVFTYLQLTMEDYHWWWRSFLSAGSVAFYTFLYSINYLVVDLHNMHGTLSAVVYLGYSLLMAFAIFLAMGTVGFIATFGFVYYLFASVKLD